MEDIEVSPASKKRSAPDDNEHETKPLNLKGTQFMMPTPPDTDQSSNVSPSSHNQAVSRHASPAPSSSALSSVETAENDTVQSTNNTIDLTSSAATTSTPGPPAKRRKLTPSEKLMKQREKEQKEVEKAEQKARKEEEKRVKDEEKRKKTEEREEEKRVKDEEKRVKAEEREAKKRERDLEEERKAQEKLKKERSQMRLGVFFQKPATPVAQNDSDGFGKARRKSLSLEPFDAVADDVRRSQSPIKGTQMPVAAAQTPAKPQIPEYYKHFLPFQLSTHSSLARDWRPHFTDERQASFDEQLNDHSLREKYDLGLVDSYANLERQFSHERQTERGLPLPNVKSLIAQIQGSLEQPIDFTSDQKPTNPVDLLQTASRRYLEFSEDVRPPYYGTYTKHVSPRTSRKMRRNPFTRSRKDTDYDYDSEAEWEEPEEGEDLVDEDDDEKDSVGDADEMDEFLDDEDDALKNKRKLITGDLVPMSTGLRWEDRRGKIVSSTEDSTTMQSMAGMRIGFLIPGFTGTTIDPFSTAYWDPAAFPKKSVPAAEVAVPTSSALRPPLQPRISANGTLEHVLVGASEGEKGPITSLASAGGSKRGPKPAPKTLSSEDMEEFKEAVVDSPLSKADLQKGLKARFPKLTNDTIKATLGGHFAQVGASKADRKWVFVST